jgi:hypothetical protein
MSDVVRNWKVDDGPATTFDARQAKSNDLTAK